MHMGKAQAAMTWLVCAATLASACAGSDDSPSAAPSGGQDTKEGSVSGSSLPEARSPTAGATAPDAAAGGQAHAGAGGRAAAGDSSARSAAAGGGAGGTSPAAGGAGESPTSAAAGSGGMLAPGSGPASAGDGATAAGSGGSSSPDDPESCSAAQPGAQGKNPLLSDVFTADPGALVDGCTFYIHCGHDEGPRSFVLNEWFVLSSTDMVTWKHQVALKVSDFDWADANAWAGQVVKKNGKYFWFVPVQERGGGMTIGVAVGDSPLGPFQDAIGKPLINDAFEMSNAGFRTPSDTPFTIDPTVLVDDDGTAYLHYGGFGRMVVAKLSDDMLAIDGKLEEVTPRGFFEAPYLFKHAGRYYEVYAAGQNPATIDYATSDSPLGPWTYGGRILDALPNQPGEDAATNHAAVAELAGQWYIVYHISNGPNGGGTYKRQVSVDKLTIAADGTIGKVTPSAGLQF